MLVHIKAKYIIDKIPLPPTMTDYLKTGLIDDQFRFCSITHRQIRLFFFYALTIFIDFRRLLKISTIYAIYTTRLYFYTIYPTSYSTPSLLTQNIRLVYIFLFSVLFSDFLKFWWPSTSDTFILRISTVANNISNISNRFRQAFWWFPIIIWPFIHLFLPFYFFYSDFIHISNSDFTCRSA